MDLIDAAGLISIAFTLVAIAWMGRSIRRDIWPLVRRRPE